ncbi:MAG: glycosyltransferase family 4 protein [Terriglobales bacterium]
MTERQRAVIPTSRSKCRVALLTGGFDKPYVYGLVTALGARQIPMDVIGSNDIFDSRFSQFAGVALFDFRRRTIPVGFAGKLSKLLMYYIRLIGYAATCDASTFHILWNNKFELFDRVALMLYYKLLRKKIVFTAHNVNAGQRDGNDSRLNRLTLKIQYRLCDHIFVHTPKMKQQLLEEFGVLVDRISIIPFGINDSLPETSLTVRQARQRLGIGEEEKAILFFGSIRPYKGLGFLVEAFQKLAADDGSYRLIIAGEPRPESDGDYADQIHRLIDVHSTSKQVIARIQYIPDQEVELYFKAADVLVLPYSEVFQSGVLFLGYNFGLPAVAANVGSFREDIVAGETGFLANSCSAGDLTKTVQDYFASDLFKSLQSRRPLIRERASARNSWATVANITCNVYASLQAHSCVLKAR